MEQFAAARDMSRYESDRLSSIFSAFLLANTVLMGFLLHAATGSGGFPGEPGTAVAGGLVGLCVSGLWFTTYERNAAALGMRITRASETEPDGQVSLDRTSRTRSTRVRQWCSMVRTNPSASRGLPNLGSGTLGVC